MHPLLICLSACGSGFGLHNKEAKARFTAASSTTSSWRIPTGFPLSHQIYSVQCVQGPAWALLLDHIPETPLNRLILGQMSKSTQLTPSCRSYFKLLRLIPSTLF